MDILTGFLSSIGRVFLAFLAAVGRVSLFIWAAVSGIFRGPFYTRILLKQLMEVGYYSLPVVGMTSLFTGAALAIQTYNGFSRFSAESSVAIVVVLAITRELGPVMAGLMVAGRIGAAYAAEIGTMRVTEQIDALTTLSTDPYKYLVLPRLIAGLTMLPILVGIGDIIGVFGGYMVSIHNLGFAPGPYIKSTAQFLEMNDVISGLVKASVFGFIITLMGCYHGFNSKGGAQGVGAATTHAVVSSSILILLSNYFLTAMFFGK
ncbi:MAG: ABC transporter permease [Alphaproteobacteria bacterium]|nr:ABC transporter permease [Alphaproteobacteria bacterium]